ncbi:DUF4382 domain-containing protein [Shewanella sp. AS16]|uniref:DUF4382 domain-containing protein n=1 Tax=Shewanella sp. AS16 TaxID=2907625 RepID=UPI001F18D180|nr:DUF4382 domain-containing protein [Shewanella sp. AS16]MCE9687586.1 DUF4382 domain-containing protein [Shewanella sp. AS16]
MNYSKTLIAMTLASLLAGCGGSNKDNAPEMAFFNLGVSDNPADAKEVNIAFKQVVLKNSTGSFSFDVSSNGELKQVNLLDFQGADIETLVNGQQVPVGEYQMCIYMQNDETANADGSHVLTQDDMLQGLVTNSNGSCGGVGADEPGTGRLFFNKSFTLAAGANNFVAEFNLGQGLQDPHGNKAYWTLKPTAVQLMNTAEVGSIKGQISPETMTDCETAAGGSTFSPAVYLYPGDTALADMADFRPEADLGTQVAPIASARVNELLDDNQQVIGHDYEFGFVVAGTYSLGYSCVAQNDDPDLVNAPTDTDNAFFLHADEQAVVVSDGTATERNFPEGFVAN